jgi:biopolymer transport protein ExbD
MLHTALQPEAQPIPEINTTPLIDVMLVLLTMLLITIPAATHSVNLSLPTVPPKAVVRPAVDIDIDFDGSISWNGHLIQSLAQFEAYCRATAGLDVQPDVRVKANRRVKYDSVAQVLEIAQRNGLQRLGVAGIESP